MRKAICLTSIALILFNLQGCIKSPATLYDGTTEHDRYKPVVKDLEDFPQDAHTYIPNLNSRSEYFSLQEGYDEKYFEPWNYKEPPFSKEDILWPFTSYTYDKSYGENLKPLPEEWFAKMKDVGNYELFGTLNKKAISLSYLHLRNFPTHKPVFKDPSLAGEGFPFDYLQNSGVHANEPLFISHFSKDGRWAYVFTAYATGWVEKSGIAFIDDFVSQNWQDAEQIELIDEYYPIKDLDDNFVFQSRVGMRLALISIQKTHYIALAITAGKNNSASFTKVKIPLAIAKQGKLIFNANNLEKITNLMLQSHYGWGGLYQEKDCSSMLRDLYAPFGIWLPRNSFQQAKMGRVIPLHTLSIPEKRLAILEHAVPFETLLYKKGHILLYLGEYNGKISVLHNVWGIRTIENGEEGRKVIGKTVVSSLDLGKERENYDVSKSILSRLSSMNIITQEKQLDVNTTSK